MSAAATIEPPVTEQPKPEQAGAIAPGKTPVSVVLDMSQVLKGKKEPEQVITKETKEATAEQKTVETPKEKQPEAEQKPEQSKPSDKEENMANLRKARETAEQKASALETRLSELQKQLEEASKPKVPEDVQAKLTDYEKKVEELSRNLRMASLERDPEFQERFTKGIQSKLGMMAQIAKEAKIPEDTVLAGMGAWNAEVFAEWQEQMTPGQRVKFQAAWVAAEELHQQRAEALTNADKTWTELQKQREEEATTQRKAVVGENEKLARSILKELVLDNENLQDYKDLAGAAEAVAMQAARYEMPVAEVFKNVVANQVLARVTQKQAGQIEELNKTIAEQKTKIADLEKFVSEQAGAVPRPSATGGNGVVDDKTPIWQRIQIGAPR